LISFCDEFGDLVRLRESLLCFGKSSKPGLKPMEQGVLFGKRFGL